MAKEKSFSRTKFFIDPKLQGRYMITFLVPMLIMLVFMLLTLYFASQTIISTAGRIVKQEVSTTISNQLMDQAEPTAEQYRDVVEQIEFRVSNFGNAKGLKKEFAGTLLGIFAVGILLVVIQVVMMTVFFSHKLAGPVFRFEKACRRVIDGDYTDVIKLRKGDQLNNLADLLNDAIRLSGEIIKQKEKIK
ncbi:MAG: hypothetical protein LBB56_06535 [Chitinispirillales bacterium]|jgi:nitrate/nitrite-specific signal transduction histidine kinase|nr:hypothetical protein [Chitinispirillales bacterium]